MSKLDVLRKAINTNKPVKPTKQKGMDTSALPFSKAHQTRKKAK